MIDKRTQRQIKRLFAVVTDDSLMDADFEYVRAAIVAVRAECDQVEEYMNEMDRLADEIADSSKSNA